MQQVLVDLKYLRFYSAVTLGSTKNYTVMEMIYQFRKMYQRSFQEIENPFSRILMKVFAWFNFGLLAVLIYFFLSLVVSGRIL